DVELIAALRALRDPLDARPDAEAQEERLRVLGQPLATRGVVDGRITAPAPAVEFNAAVRGPEVTVEVADVAGGLLEHLVRDALLVRAQVPGAERVEPLGHRAPDAVRVVPRGREVDLEPRAAARRRLLVNDPRSHLVAEDARA